MANFVDCSSAAGVKAYCAWQNGTIQNHQDGKCCTPLAIYDRGKRWLQRRDLANRGATIKQLTARMN